MMIKIFLTLFFIATLFSNPSKLVITVKNIQVGKGNIVVPSEPYVPMMSIGEGSNIVCAGRKSFMINSSLMDVECSYFDEYQNHLL